MKILNQGGRVWIRLGVVFVLFVLAVFSSPAANVMQTFFIPLPEDQMQTSMKAIDGYAGRIGDEMQSAISMVAGTDGTILYYDHWEDGYEVDISNPTQLTSQVWGDSNAANGYPPGIPSDVFDAGDVIRLEGLIDVTRNSVTLEYDGRDKVSVTQPIAVTRAMYAADPGAVFAEAIGVYDVGSHGTEYRTPVGEGTGIGVNTNEMFSYSALYVMADYDFTRVDIDKDNDGVFEETVYLDQGKVYLINGGVKAGATVRGSQPFQCTLVTGDIGSNYEMRWFELWPESQWDSAYLSPIGSRTNLAGTTLITAHVYLFNPNATTITVTYETATTTGSITVSPNSTENPFLMPVNGAARFYTADGSKFFGVTVFDTGGTCQAYDWGIGLMPERMMSTAGVVGWGPGDGNTVPLNNGNPLWIAAKTNTTIYVDFDSDPTTGSLVDPQGNQYDFSTNALFLQMVQVVDTNDNDQTGMRYYTVDGVALMGAWGQDASRAGTGNPYLDMGYAIPSFPTVMSRKFASLLTDNNDNGYADSGDTIEYFVDVINAGFATANHVIFQDDLPTNLTTYVTNSAALGASYISDDLPPKLTRFPFDEGGYDIGTIAIGETSTVRYVTEVVTDLPADFSGFIHNNATVGGTNGSWTGGSILPVRVSGLTIEKQTSTTSILDPGDSFTYTITVENTGTVTYTGVNLQDTLPLGITYVEGSAQIQVDGSVTNTVKDRFTQQAYTNNNGTIPWISNWQEVGESDGVAGGDVQVRGDVMANSVESYAVRIGDLDKGLSRQADLSGHSSATLSFNYRRVGLDSGTDVVGVYISTNDWVSSDLLLQLQGAADDAAYQSTNIAVSAYISTNTGIRMVSTATLEADDYVWFDDITFTLTGSNATYAAAAPPTLVENLTLPPSGSITVDFDVQVKNPPVAIEVVNQARVRADQSVPWTESNPVTNQINATAGITLLKTASTTNELAAGTNLTYTIDITNTGTIWQTGIELEDLLPFGMTYSNGTAQLIRNFAHTNIVSDVFNFKTYTNSDGNIAWDSAWTETGDDSDPTTGEIQIAVDGSSIPGQTYAVRTVGTSSFQRGADLSGATSARVEFDYRRFNFEADDYVLVSASANGGGSFTQVGQIGGATNDGSYFAASFDISAYATDQTVIRFSGSGNRDTNDIIWLDNIQMIASASNATNALPDPPQLLDGYTLPAQTNMTVQFEVTVDAPLATTLFVNTARLRSDQQTAWISSSVTNTAPGTSGLTLTKETNLSNDWKLEETNTYTITVVNTGSVTQTGIDLTDLLPAGVDYAAGSTIIELTDVVPFQTNITHVYTTNTVRDEFNVNSYTNNDGTVDWNADWDEADNKAYAHDNGRIRATGNRLRFVKMKGAWYASRGADLSGYSGAQLTYDWETESLEANEEISVLISTNGSAPYVEVASYGGESSGSGSIDISSYISTNTTIRFGNLGADWNDNDDKAYFDNIEIEFIDDVATTNILTNVVVGVTTNAGGAVSNLATNYTLGSLDHMTVTFEATLSVPLVSTQLVNAASVISDQLPEQSASVTNSAEANSVGDFVWFDTVEDGVQDPAETGLAGVEVRLYSSQSNLLLTTTSAADGSYEFTDLPSGDYYLEFVTPTNYAPALQNQGGNDALDSDINTNGITSVFTLSGGGSDVDQDAGFSQPVSTIETLIWLDADLNGIQNSESGATNVVVRLYDENSALIAVVTNNAAGTATFTNVPPGNYFMEYDLLSGYTFTLPDLGADDALDSDVTPSTRRTDLFNVPPGTTVSNQDAGLVDATSGLTIDKTSDLAVAATSGDVITYTITVENTGTVTQAGVAIDDVLPAGLTYVSGSAYVVASSYTTNTYTIRDEFGTSGFSNNDGTTNWLGDWQEVDGDGLGATTGNAQINGGELSLDDNPDTGGRPSLSRGANLAESVTAVVTFDWRTDTGVDANDSVFFQVSDNDGGSWTTLNDFTGITGAQSGSSNFNIQTYASSNTLLRFEVNNLYGGGSETFFVDDLQVQYTEVIPDAETGSIGALPGILSGANLDSGEGLIVTFEATVDSPVAVTQLVNTASTYGATHSVISDSVTNEVGFADVGVFKTVSDATPDMVEIIEYTLTASNSGPSVATGVVITDVLPSDLQYNSVSNGTYNPTSGAWDIGTLAVGASTSLYINVTVRENTSGKSIVNTATVTGNDLFDPNPSNDTSSIEIIPKGGASIGDWVWFDTDGDGIQDASEVNGITNVPVYLVDTNDVRVDQTITDASGHYQFENIPPGTYRLQFDTTATTGAWVQVTTPNAGSETNDSDAISGAWGEILETTNYVFLSGVTNVDIDVGITYANSTYAEVAEVRGELRDDTAYVVWEISSEFNTAGYNAYLNDIRINKQLVGADILQRGGRYETVVATTNETETIRLEEIELNGTVRDLGTHNIVFGDPRPVAMAAPMAMAAPLAMAADAPSEPSDVLKIFVRNDGIFGVDLQAVADGMGRDSNEIQNLVFTDSLRLSGQGETIPTYWDAANNRLLFYGQGVDSRYTRDNVYLLSEGSGLPMAIRPADAATGRTGLPVDRHFEEAGYGGYWGYAMSGYLQPDAAFSATLDLSGFADSELELTVRLDHGYSETAGLGHTAQIDLNGFAVESVDFADFQSMNAIVTIPFAHVLNGNNLLTIHSINTNHANYFWIDWVDATFDCDLTPSADTQIFQALENMDAPAFDQPVVLALDADNEPAWIRGVSNAWKYVEGDHRFALAEAANIPNLGTSSAVADAWFLSEFNRIDYLVITSEALKDAAQELADYREGQGLKTGVAVFEDICDLMTGGLRTPEAISELLRFARANWAQAPWLVVLAGSGHCDYFDAYSSEVNHIPPMLFETHDGLFSADGLLADLDGDQLPDLAIGRLPALTSADLTAMIAKIKAYEAGFGSAVENQLVFAADAADSDAGDFAAANRSLAGLAGGTYPVEQINLDTVEIADARAQLISHFNSGAGFIHYTGHGGVNNFSAKNLLNASDVSGLLRSDTPPVVVALSCLVGRYEVPGLNGMGEMLMRKANGGAVSVWGPSGLSRNAPAVELGKAFYQAVLQEGSGTLGLAILQARRSLQGDLFSGDTFAIYNLLGDPALRIAGNASGQPSEKTFEKWRWQYFSPDDLADPEVSGMLADPLRNGWNNLLEYAFGSESSGGGVIPALEFADLDGDWVDIRWRQRRLSSDLEYRIWVSTNLVDWELAPSSMQILSTLPLPDEVLEKVTARIFDPGKSLFIKLDVIRKK